MTSDPGPIGSVTIGAACAIFDARGRVLLVRHTYGQLNWELPGGLVQPGEDPMSGARRELAEETSLHVGPGRLCGAYYEREHWSGQMLHVVFRFDPPDSEPVARPPEIGDVGWFALDALPRPMSDFTERRIQDALEPGAAYGVVGPRKWRE